MIDKRPLISAAYWLQPMKNKLAEKNVPSLL
jgi:hypothetical protein